MVVIWQSGTGKSSLINAIFKASLAVRGLIPIFFHCSIVFRRSDMMKLAGPISTKESPHLTMNIWLYMIPKVMSQETKRSSVSWRDLSLREVRRMPSLRGFTRFGAHMDDVNSIPLISCCFTGCALLYLTLVIGCSKKATKRFSSWIETKANTRNFKTGFWLANQQ